MPTVSDIARLLQTAVRGDGQRTITGMATLNTASDHQISFLSSDAFVRQYRTTRAAAVIVQRQVNLPASSVANSPALLLVDDADLAVAKVLEYFAPPMPTVPRGVASMRRWLPPR